ncbi:S-layer homology domain-containing protein [Oscillibacter sp.]|uniref:S-layer homology domain-containing protein n=1 Tax=Oscillibacter sp. TaxID=1945593 RepID=UPI0026070210|nr:S-layer homology domain-containing protein [Oscillibacter sp.]MDD3346276.1 S-layer homology domain-containing protein [Oscillibacter sp.]
MKKLLALLTALALTAALALPAAAVGADYTDIPQESTLRGEIEKAVGYGLMNGYDAARFGYADSMTRAQFTAVLVRMMGWYTETPAAPTYADVPAAHTWYAALETAAAHGVSDFTWTDAGKHFRPDAPITRGEMAKLLVQALGLETAALSLNSSSAIPFSDLNHHLPFTDIPFGNEGYISVAYTIGMTKGTSATTFSPNLTATRVQAAAMLVRVYEKLRHETDFVHGFYAISSYSQLALTDSMDAVSAGWSRMTWNGTEALLSTTAANGNEYAVPSGYAEVTDYLDARQIPLHLSVFMDASDGVGKLLSSKNGRAQAVSQIVNELTVTYETVGKNPYSGVTIDFEGLNSTSRADFNAFISALSAQVHSLGKKLYICVQPVPSTSSVYTNSYDYATLGTLSDKLIVMAHDYDPRTLESFAGGAGDLGDYYENCPTVPLSSVYRGLRDVVELVDPGKVVLAISSRNVAWQIDGEGKLVSGTPVSVSPEAVSRRLAQPDTETGWSEAYQQSYAIYTTEDASRYFLWYQNDDSVRMEVATARLLGVDGVSFWRLGTLPSFSGWNWLEVLKAA